MTKTNQIVLFFIPILLSFSYIILLSRPIDLVTADIGRHIKNGEAIFNGNFEVLTENFYSYSFPNYPTANHHWLAGVVFFLIWKGFGFFGVHLFFILTSLATLLIFFKLSCEKSGAAIASLITILLIPLILERDEIRPEIFSNLFAGIFLLILTKFRGGRLKPKYLLILPAIELAWVNTHIYFFLGFVVIGTFLAEAIFERSKSMAKTVVSIIMLMIVSVFINPAGIKGVLAPLSIFKNYGYTIVENQNIFFLEKLIRNPNFLILKIMFLAFLFLIISRIIQNKKAVSVSDLIFAAGFSFAAFFALRNVTIFALFAFPISSGCVSGLIGGKPSGIKINIATLAVLTFFITSILSGEYRPIVPYEKFGFGLISNNNAANFINSRDIETPIFNNYDIGGYLIFNLPPDKKVFVDNRPEAYPSDFFQKVYIPMQENKSVWDEQLKTYEFKTIIFSTADYTPWGRKFLDGITKDPDWETAFLDSRVIILTKN